MPRGPRRGAFLRLCAARRAPLLRSRKPGRLCDCGFSAQRGRARPCYAPAAWRSSHGRRNPPVRQNAASTRRQARGGIGSMAPVQLAALAAACEIWPLRITPFGHSTAGFGTTARTVSPPPAGCSRPPAWAAFLALVTGRWVSVIGHPAPSGEALPSPRARARGGKTKYEGKSSRR